MATKEITRSALRLPAKSRARLASQLLESLDASSKERKRLDALWAAECERRIDQFEAGTSEAIPASEVLAHKGKRRR